MRAIPYPLSRSSAATPELQTHHIAPPPPRCSAGTCPWWPYYGAKDFRENAAIIILVVFLAMALALALNIGIRYLIRRQCRRNKKSAFGVGNGDATENVPTTIYSEEMRGDGGGEMECMICLSEFVIGERIRVLERCGHGFHVQCIQKWLVSHTSCPTCRAQCSFIP